MRRHTRLGRIVYCFCRTDMRKMKWKEPKTRRTMERYGGNSLSQICFHLLRTDALLLSGVRFVLLCVPLIWWSDFYRDAAHIKRFWRRKSVISLMQPCVSSAKHTLVGKKRCDPRGQNPVVVYISSYSSEIYAAKRYGRYMIRTHRQWDVETTFEPGEKPKIKKNKGAKKALSFKHETPNLFIA